GWKPVRHIDEVLRRWVREDEGKLRELSYDMEQWANRLRSKDLAAYKEIFECYHNQKEKIPEFKGALEQISLAIGAITKRIEEIRGEALRDAAVSEERLHAVGRSASRTAFERDSAGFPVSMFREIQAIDIEGERHSLVLRRRDKGEYTQPPM